MKIFITTDDELDANFEGFMIPVYDWDVGNYQVPGWKCKHCGWIVGTQGYPPSHTCPDDGIELQTRILEKRQKEFNYTAPYGNDCPDCEDDGA